AGARDASPVNTMAHTAIFMIDGRTPSRVDVIGTPQVHRPRTPMNSRVFAARNGDRGTRTSDPTSNAACIQRRSNTRQTWCRESRSNPLEVTAGWKAHVLA